MSEELCDVGLYGLAVMGQNFALNMASKGFSVCVGNRSPAKVDLTVQRAKDEGNLPLVGSTRGRFPSSLARWTVRSTLAGLRLPTQTLNPLEAILRAKFWPITARPVKADVAEFFGHASMVFYLQYVPSSNREKTLESSTREFERERFVLGREAYDQLEPILTKCAAQVDDGACTGYVGPIGAGNYVKMVHNGIEYGDMQLIAEVYDVLRSIVGMSNDEMSKTFAKWNEGILDSYLIEITYKILAKPDDVTGEGYVVDYVLDKTGSKGTGRWTVQEAAEQSVAAPTLAAALDSRYISSRKEERVAASKVLDGPKETPNVSKFQIIEDLEAALYAAKICSYAQGMGLIKAASDSKDWNIDLSMCAKMWKGGCIIRAKLLDKIQAAFSSNPSLSNLMVDPAFATELNERSMAWRRIITLCVASGVSCPALCASLNYFDSYRRESLPANLTQAQRDFFGGHTYERIDREGPFHCAWTDAHKAIGDISERTAGEKATRD
eukprot:CAMPEP_0178663476 /NCGR_PEP_ID=MMETSP0698-20121128/28845_1 /TAXON_ID=265572 /ORGANISM="Extubocellulus spinifer, Strain CCMP396" /LENGTH=494 /DNA_ID=CAMNT_0020306535 /DNA_START=229 /DNA_END=1713 /DNA_ORIENTATION=-